MALDINDLRQIALFADVPQKHLEVLLKNLRPLHMEEGQAMIQEGEITRAPLFIITDGNVEVSRKDAEGVSRTLAIIEPPTVIGEVEFLGDIESTASVTTHDDIAGYLLPRERFLALLEAEEPAAFHLALAIGRVVSERLVETNKMLSKALAK